MDDGKSREGGRKLDAEDGLEDTVKPSEAGGRRKWGGSEAKIVMESALIQ